MAKTTQKKGKLRRKLTDKYRLVILNEDTFQERFSLKLSRLNVFVLGGIFSLLLVSLTTVFIAFTPIKEYIPGYSSTALKKQATRLMYKTDSLNNKLKILTYYTESLKPVLTGDVSQISAVDTVKREAFKVDKSSLGASKADSIFREKVEESTRFDLGDFENEQVKLVLFSPVEGVFSQEFNADNKHFAVDITAKTGTPVKTIADGTVIFSEWTTETGYVLIIEHPNDFISVYKHNSVLLKHQGDVVTSGEVIATVGSTGENSTGPHLHFELWKKGYPVNPKNYIDFQ